MKIILLILATFIWGAGFVGTRWTLVDFGPVWSNGLRFVFASLIGLLITFAFSLIKKVNLRTLFYSREALYCGGVLWIALQLQTIGIGLTSLSKSGFLTTFYALFTPLFCFILFGSRFKKAFWLLLLVSLVGVAMLCELDIKKINNGDLFILASAVFFSLHIILVDRYCQNVDAFIFNIQQIHFIAIISIPFGLYYEGMPALEKLITENSYIFGSSLWGFIILALFSSILAFSIQVYAQKGIAPHIVGLVFLMESVFSTFFGYLLFDERLTPLMIAGCILILVAIAMVPFQLKVNRKVATY
tara:strand:+ start:420656 stop:421558 length:903 start_codon:yes stop_codon:yes gene_type:complete